MLPLKMTEGSFIAIKIPEITMGQIMLEPACLPRPNPQGYTDLQVQEPKPMSQGHRKALTVHHHQKACFICVFDVQKHLKTA